jgi:hypothetical protein
MTAPVLAPPPVLTDSHGLRWIYAGMTDLGPAYQPEQLPLVAPHPAQLAQDSWAEVRVCGESE